jgi:hypothetical protein
LREKSGPRDSHLHHCRYWCSDSQQHPLAHSAPVRWGSTRGSITCRSSGRRSRPREGRKAVCARLGIKPSSAVFEHFAWLGLFDDRPLPMQKGTLRDVISFLFGEKLVYTEGERDLVILKDEMTAFNPKTGKRLRHISTLVDFDIPGGDSSIARTTGLPPILASRRRAFASAKKQKPCSTQQTSEGRFRPTLAFPSFQQMCARSQGGEIPSWASLLS